MWDGDRFVLLFSLALKFWIHLRFVVFLHVFCVSFEFVFHLFDLIEILFMPFILILPFFLHLFSIPHRLIEFGFRIFRQFIFLWFHYLVLQFLHSVKMLIEFLFGNGLMKRSDFS